jgi:hypothetical protein
MAVDGSKPKRHFILDNMARPEPFRPAGGGGGDSEVPRQNRQAHGQGLQQQFNDLKPAIAQARTRQEAMGMKEGFGLQIEFESFPDIELAFESLAVEASGIELLNVRHEEHMTYATVSVPDGKLHILENRIIAYLDDPNAWAESPASNSTDSIHDPGQAWNALTVGASTELIHISEPDAGDYNPIAPSGGLSPFSTTSHIWEGHWPLKPDVVFEGGNAAKDTIGAAWMHSLSLLTTNSDINARLFTTTRATSAASALAARMAARLMAEYPELRKETIRGLIVHSAAWTPAMKQQFLANPAKRSKSDVARLVRHCGFGQPDLVTALWSVENSLTLICEDSLLP